MIKIKIITGSVRPGRFNIQPATWMHAVAKKHKDIAVELIDLEKINLPFLDEPIPASQKKYSNKHTIEWSRIIDEADGFIFVTPEYNHSYSPVLKNAIDFLFYEWNFKPVSFISYGAESGGSRAVEHLRSVVAQLKMYDLQEQLLLPNYWEHLDSSGAFTFTENHIASAETLLSSLTFWAASMKNSREILHKKV